MWPVLERGHFPLGIQKYDKVHNSSCDSLRTYLPSTEANVSVEEIDLAAESGSTLGPASSSRASSESDPASELPSSTISSHLLSRSKTLSVIRFFGRLSNSMIRSRGTAKNITSKIFRITAGA
ncbi:hypothetical protein [Crucivirus-373]|nr:hypothetical protein [Crucivirus-373]